MTTVKPKERHVSVNNLRLHYLDWEAEGKPPMLCLHGHTGEAHLWDEFAEAMSPSYHVYSLDQRGHGDSQWAADGYDRDRFVEDLAAFLDALALPKVVLVGHSMGGWNTLLYTASHQERVDRIVIVDIAPEPSEASRQQFGSRPPTPLGFTSFEETVARSREGNPWATDARLRQDMANKLRQRQDGSWIWKADPALFNTPLRDPQDPELTARYWRSLAAITCPILEVRGAESPLVSDEVLERMREANPGFTSVDIHGAGHVVPMDKPREFIEAARAFLGVPATGR